MRFRGGEERSWLKRKRKKGSESERGGFTRARSEEEEDEERRSPLYAPFGCLEASKLRSSFYDALCSNRREEEGSRRGQGAPIAKGFFFRPSAKELRPLWQASPPSALTLPARSELELPLFLSQRCRSNLSSVPGAWKGQEIEARCRVAARFASSLSNSVPAFRSLSRSCRRLFPMSSTTEAADQFFYFSLSLSFLQNLPMLALLDREKFGSLHRPGASSSLVGTSGNASLQLSPPAILPSSESATAPSFDLADQKKRACARSLSPCLSRAGEVQMLLVLSDWMRNARKLCPRGDAKPIKGKEGREKNESVGPLREREKQKEPL